jgi:hypothetical protein
VLAVGCPFCKSMLESTPGKDADGLVVRDVAELLWEGVQRCANPSSSQVTLPVPAYEPTPPSGRSQAHGVGVQPISEAAGEVVVSMDSLQPTAPSPSQTDTEACPIEPTSISQTPNKRKSWTPKRKVDS